MSSLLRQTAPNRQPARVLPATSPNPHIYEVINIAGRAIGCILLENAGLLWTASGDPLPTAESATWRSPPPCYVSYSPAPCSSRDHTSTLRISPFHQFIQPTSYCASIATAAIKIARQFLPYNENGHTPEAHRPSTPYQAAWQSIDINPRHLFCQAFDPNVVSTRDRPAPQKWLQALNTQISNAPSRNPKRDQAHPHPAAATYFAASTMAFLVMYLLYSKL